MLTVYGIKPCNTVKKARLWLEDQDIAYHFHDFRVQGLDEALLERFERVLGWETLLNRRGTTWRTLSEAEREGLDRAKALALMLARPTLIKRPILERGDRLLIGFSSERYAQELLTP